MEANSNLGDTVLADELEDAGPALELDAGNKDELGIKFLPRVNGFEIRLFRASWRRSSELRPTFAIAAAWTIRRS